MAPRSPWHVDATATLGIAIATLGIAIATLGIAIAAPGIAIAIVGIGAPSMISRSSSVTFVTPWS